MLNRASRPERLFLGPTFSALLSAVGVAAMAFWGGGAEKWLVMLISVIIGVIATVQIRARNLFKGPNYPMLATFMLLQGAASQSISGCLLAGYALITTISLFFCFMQPKLTRTFFLIFLLTGTAAVFNPQWLMWGGVTVALLITVRAFSMRGLVASLLGIITPYIIIPFGAVALTRSLEPLEHLLVRYQQPQFEFPAQITSAYLFSAALCALFALASFLTAYGYPAKARSRNMSIYVLSGSAIVCPLFCIGGSAFWLPLLNLCAAYHCAHFIATRRSGWLIAIAAWMFILAFIGKQLCIF